MTPTHLKTLAAAALAALSANGFAQQTAEEPATRLPAVTVRGAAPAGGIPLDTTASAGSRLGTTLRETPASVDLVTRDLMRERGNRTTQRL